MMEEEDWFELFDYIEALFSARGLNALLADDEENDQARVIETMRLLYTDLKNTNQATAQSALQLIAGNAGARIETEYFTIGATDVDEPSDADRIVEIRNLPDNTALQETIRRFVIDLGGPDFGSDPDGGFTPGGGGGPSPFGNFILEPSLSRRKSEIGEDEQVSEHSYDIEDSQEQNQHQSITLFGSGM